MDEETPTKPAYVNSLNTFGVMARAQMGDQKVGAIGLVSKLGPLEGMGQPQMGCLRYGPSLQVGRLLHQPQIERERQSSCHDRRQNAHLLTCMNDKCGAYCFRAGGVLSRRFRRWSCPGWLAAGPSGCDLFGLGRKSFPLSSKASFLDTKRISVRYPAGFVGPECFAIEARRQLSQESSTRNARSRTEAQTGIEAGRARLRADPCGRPGFGHRVPLNRTGKKTQNGATSRGALLQSSRRGCC